MPKKKKHIKKKKNELKMLHYVLKVFKLFFPKKARVIIIVTLTLLYSIPSEKLKQLLELIIKSNLTERLP